MITTHRQVKATKSTRHEVKHNKTEGYIICSFQSSLAWIYRAPLQGKMEEKYVEYDGRSIDMERIGGSEMNIMNWVIRYIQA